MPCFRAFTDDECEIPGTLLCKKAAECPRGDARALWHGTSDAAAKQTRRQEDAKQRDSRLALACLAHFLASNLQVPLLCHQGSVMEAQSSERHRRAAVEEAP